MKRLGIKFIINTLLVVLFAFLIADRMPKGNRGRTDGTGVNGVLPISDDVRSALSETLGDAAAQSFLSEISSARPQLSLPRDPFTFRPSRDMQRHPQQTGEQQTSKDAVQPPVEDILRLKATVIDRYGAMAFINDEVLREGESIIGYKIVNIAAGFVELARGDNMIYLHLEDGKTP